MSADGSAGPAEFLEAGADDGEATGDAEAESGSGSGSELPEAPAAAVPTASGPSDESGPSDSPDSADSPVASGTECVEIPKQQSAEEAADSEAGEGARK
ncbi:hypothetical protein ACIQMR_28580 [Streptomyces sp. NPDC091376]|uniref:hypothetical protein n=1 Tax=Streptomyces sp. NPDC091376 TaxID=3365994 RepID=UPI003803CC4D